MSTPPFQYSAQFLVSIERTISKERLNRYLFASRQDMVKALELYERNAALSEAMYGIIQGVEIAVRNAAHVALANGFNTQRWYDKAPLSPYHMDKRDEAIRKAGLHPSPGKVMAELTFGFWTDLVAKNYHGTLWVPYLHKAFPNTTLHRHSVHRRLETIRWLRNRVAHHETILTSRQALYAGHGKQITLAEVMECSVWICRDTTDWLASRSCYRQADAILTEVGKMGIHL